VQITYIIPGYTGVFQDTDVCHDDKPRFESKIEKLGVEVSKVNQEESRLGMEPCLVIDY
jgi:hypothetical protein